MKNKLALLFVLTTTFAMADGGTYRYGTRCYVNVMDNVFNLYYTSLNGEYIEVTKKGKTNTTEITSNINIYDIKTKTITTLFAESLKTDGIVEFYFESHYDAEKKCIMFNDQGYYWREGYREPENLMGNFNLESRQPSEKLLIITRSFVTDNYILWTAHKTGKDLVKVHEFTKKTEYHVDVKNKLVRFIDEVDSKVSIKDFAY